MASSIPVSTSRITGRRSVRVSPSRPRVWRHGVGQRATWRRRAVGMVSCGRTRTYLPESADIGPGGGIGRVAHEMALPRRGTNWRPRVFGERLARFRATAPDLGAGVERVHDDRGGHGVVAGRSVVAWKPLITQAWRPRHTSSPTGRFVDRIAAAARCRASSRVIVPTSRYGPAPSSLSPADQPRTLAPLR